MAECAVGRAVRPRKRGDVRRRPGNGRQVLAVAPRHRRDVRRARAGDQNAERGILTQVIAYGWRYSIGNPYEELSYAESLDAAEVAAEYGYSSVAKSIIELSLRRMRLRPFRFTAFRGAHILSTAALYYRLTRDRAFLRAETPALDQLVERIAQRQVTSGPARGRLEPEALSTDLENHSVDSVSGPDRGGRGVLSIGRVWSSTGYAAHAARARTIAVGLDQALRPAVARARSGSATDRCSSPTSCRQKPFGRLTASRAGSYWNLVMPYALSSGWFRRTRRRHAGSSATCCNTAPGSSASREPTHAPCTGTHRERGSPRSTASSSSRFLADNDQPDQLDLSLYGMLAAGMTPAPTSRARRFAAAGEGAHSARCSCRRTPARTPRISRHCRSCSFTSAADRSAHRPDSTWRSRRRVAGSPTGRRSTCATRRRASAR